MSVLRICLSRPKGLIHENAIHSLALASTENLRLADNDSDGSPMDSDGEELSSSISEWRINLQKSWQNFMDNFITIRRRDDTAVPLLAPNQDIYLRENILSLLLVIIRIYFSR